MNAKALLTVIAATFVLSGELDQLSQAKTPSVPVVQSKWGVFTSKTGRFSVLMPSTPKYLRQTQKTQIGPIELQSFVAAIPQQDVAYRVAYSDFPYSYGRKDNAQQIFDGIRENTLKVTRSNLRSERNISLNGSPGREIQFGSGVQTTTDRMYLVDGRLYQVIVQTTTVKEKYIPGSIAGFLNSFRVLPKNQI